MQISFKILNSKFQIPNAIIGIWVFLFGISATAQCAMCRASLESEGNKTKVEAVNDGIVFLMAVPYIIVAVIGFAIYRMYFKKSKILTPKS
jgi:heme/copper-type cytochrome/quinol oxidase subunit 2